VNPAYKRKIAQSVSQEKSHKETASAGARALPTPENDDAGANLFQRSVRHVLSLSRMVWLCWFIFRSADVCAQHFEHKLYAAVISNRNYVVGRDNAGTGLFLVSEDGSQWKNLGFKNMRTFAVEVFPEYGEGLIYTANGNGVIMSRDHGKSWRVTTGWRITEVLEAAVIPSMPEVIYAGTAYGLWKSIDFGENWQRLTNRFVAGLHIDYVDPNRVYVGEEEGMLISNDAGISFQRVKELHHAVRDIAQEERDPNRLYIGTEDHGVFVSNDRGRTWKQISGKFKAATVYAVHIDRRDPNRIFAATFASGVLRSTNRGERWTGFTTGLNSLPVHDVVVHPEEPSTVFAGTLGNGIYRSLDDGETWRHLALDGTHVMELEIR